ncbi:uncharacterized protein LOC118198216 isoform X2 [Stegodyphus dumicola]|uniref:uncharacterized protein LOC118198216 isoform X2 n=1 Tax=Stegodyphus dumicola TaxID=202533 RepID=UPI0015ADDBBE|nr:uncharacterized protein LOC118198216 isoform X2 [Stegodyphus dumicola]
MASSKKPTYKVETKPALERKRRKSDLVIMWLSFWDVTVNIFQEIYFTFLRLWEITKLWFSSSESLQVQTWLELYLPRIPQDFSESWRDGVVLCTLLNKLKPGCFPDAQNLDINYGLRNVYRAFDVLERHFGIVPKISVEEIVTCVEGSDVKLLDILLQLKEATDSKSTSEENTSETDESENDNHETSMSSEGCIVKGTGLVVAFLGRLANFKIFYGSLSDLDFVIDIRGPTNSVCSKRITKRSPKKKKISEASNSEISIKRSSSYSECVYNDSKIESDKEKEKEPSLIPFEYEICKNQINIGYMPVEKGQHKISILWRGHHVSDSPYILIVEDTLDVHCGSTARLKSALKSVSNNKEYSVCRRSSVRFQDYGKRNERIGKVINKRVLRHIVKIEGKDIVVNATNIESLAPALLKMDYDFQKAPLYTRRNSWGFTGDAERKISVIRQFCVEVSDPEVHSKTRTRSLSISPAGKNEICDEMKLRKISALKISEGKHKVLDRSSFYDKDVANSLVEMHEEPDSAIEHSDAEDESVKNYYIGSPEEFENVESKHNEELAATKSLSSIMGQDLGHQSDKTPVSAISEQTSENADDISKGNFEKNSVLADFSAKSHASDEHHKFPKKDAECQVFELNNYEQIYPEKCVKKFKADYICSSCGQRSSFIEKRDAKQRIIRNKSLNLALNVKKHRKKQSKHVLQFQLDNRKEIRENAVNSKDPNLLKNNNSVAKSAVKNKKSNSKMKKTFRDVYSTFSGQDTIVQSKFCDENLLSEKNSACSLVISKRYSGITSSNSSSVAYNKEHSVTDTNNPYLPTEHQKQICHMNIPPSNTNLKPECNECSPDVDVGKTTSFLANSNYETDFEITNSASINQGGIQSLEEHSIYRTWADKNDAKEQKCSLSQSQATLTFCENNSKKELSKQPQLKTYTLLPLKQFHFKQFDPLEINKDSSPVKSRILQWENTLSTTEQNEPKNSLRYSSRTNLVGIKDKVKFWENTNINENYNDFPESPSKPEFPCTSDLTQAQKCNDCEKEEHDEIADSYSSGMQCLDQSLPAEPVLHTPAKSSSSDNEDRISSKKYMDEKFSMSQDISPSTRRKSFSDPGIVGVSNEDTNGFNEEYLNQSLFWNSSKEGISPSNETNTAEYFTDDEDSSTDHFKSSTEDEYIDDEISENPSTFWGDMSLVKGFDQSSWSW